MTTLNHGHAYLRAPKSHLELMEDFRCCDGNGDGRIDYAEFKEFLDCLDAEIESEQMLIGFREIDVDRDGFINLSEFIRWWRAQ